jgi:hypothetical protein
MLSRLQHVSIEARLRAGLVTVVALFLLTFIIA